MEDVIALEFVDPETQTVVETVEVTGSSRKKQRTLSGMVASAPHLIVREVRSSYVHGDRVDAESEGGHNGYWGELIRYVADLSHECDLTGPGWELDLLTPDGEPAGESIMVRTADILRKNEEGC